MMIALADLTCATFEEKQSWLQMARYAPKEKAPVVDVFCADGLPDWCWEQAEAGLCCRVKEKRSESVCLR